MSFRFVPGKKVEVPEIPYKDQVILNPENSALIIVDMQNDFVKDEGNLKVDAAKETIKNIQFLIEAARKSNAKVIYTQDTHYENDKEWDIWPKHCEEGTWGWNIIDELKPEKSDLIVKKNRYDGFYQSNLQHYLESVWNIKNLIIAGTVANICVAHTAASAGLRWYNIVIPANAISSLTEFDQALTLRQTSWLYAGSVVKSASDISFKY